MLVPSRLALTSSSRLRGQLGRCRPRGLLLLGMVVSLLAASALCRPGHVASGGEEVALVARGPLTASCTVDGTLLPLRVLAVGPLVNGAVVYLAPDGASVARGDTLIRLDATEVEARIRSAEIEVGKCRGRVAEAERFLAEESVRVDLDVRAAALAVRRARLALDALRARPRREDLVAARAAEEGARLAQQRTLEEVARCEALNARGAASRAELEVARGRAEIARLEAERARLLLHRVEAGATPIELGRARVELEVSELTLTARRASREAVLGDARCGLECCRVELSAAQHHLRSLLRDLERHTVSAPASGLAFRRTSDQTGRPYEPGDRLDWGRSAVDLHRGGGMKVVAQAPESVLGRLRRGLACRVLVETHGLVLPAEVVRIGMLGKDANEDLPGGDRDRRGLSGRRVIEVEAVLLAQEPRLAPHMPVRLTVPTVALEDVTYVVARALRGDPGAAWVLLADGRSRRVRLGPRVGGWVVVEHGLAPGDGVVLP